MSATKVGNYDIPRGLTARCPECRAWIHVQPRKGETIGLADRAAIERFWDQHGASCGWRP